jgi:hypothetical protein
MPQHVVSNVGNDVLPRFGLEVMRVDVYDCEFVVMPLLGLPSSISQVLPGVERVRLCGQPDTWLSGVFVTRADGFLLS